MALITGWDISTSIIGVASIDEAGRLVGKTHIDLRKLDDLNAKADGVKAFFDLEWHVLPGSLHIVEERLSGFSPGRSSAGVLLKLAAFNAMVSYFLHELEAKVERLHPSTTKAILRKVGLEIPKGADKKQLTLEWAQRREAGWKVDRNRNDKVQPWCFDEADAYGLATAGWLKSPSAA